MSLIDIVKKSPARLTNDGILRDVSASLDGLNKGVRPSIQRISEHIEKTESAYIKSVESMVSDEKIYNGKCFFAIVEIATNNAIDYLTYVYHKPHIFSDVEATAGMLIDKATHLNLIAIAKFFSLYSSKMIDFAISCELIEVSDKARVSNKNAQPWTLKDLYSTGAIKDREELMVKYAAALVVFSHTLKEIEAGLAKLPKNAIINEMTEQTLGHAHNLDPLKLNGFIPIDIRVNLNPLYFFGALKADWDNYVYNSTKDEYTLALLKLQEYESMGQYGGNANAQKGIEHYTNKVQALERQIREYEEKHSGQ